MYGRFGEAESFVRAVCAVHSFALEPHASTFGVVDDASTSTENNVEA